MKKSFKTYIGVGAALAVVGFLFYGNLFMSLFQVNSMPENNQAAPITSGVRKEDITVGTGAEAAAGDLITVHYVGKLLDGKVFDSSRDRGQPFSFTLGAGQVIRGWEEGVAGMRVGGTRRLTIAPDFGYGDYAVGPIPAKSTLVFDVELLSVEKKR